MTHEKEQKSLACVKTPAKLRKRLSSAAYIFGVKIAEIDFANKRATTLCGHILQWKLRRHPELPESYENQQTTVGSVYLFSGEQK